MINILSYLKKSKEHLKDFIKENKISVENYKPPQYNYNYDLEYYNQEYYEFDSEDNLKKEVLKRRRIIEELEIMLQFYLDQSQKAFKVEVREKHKTALAHIDDNESAESCTNIEMLQNNIEAESDKLSSSENLNKSSETLNCSNKNEQEIKESSENEIENLDKNSIININDDSNQIGDENDNENSTNDKNSTNKESKTNDNNENSNSNISINSNDNDNVSNNGSNINNDGKNDNSNNNKYNLVLAPDSTNKITANQSGLSSTSKLNEDENKEKVDINEDSSYNEEASDVPGQEEFECFGAARNVTLRDVEHFPPPPSTKKTVMFNPQFVRAMKIILRHLINDMERLIELQSALIARLSELSNET